MGTRITAKGVFAEDFALEYSPPVRRGLEAWHFLNTSAAKAARNYAPGKPQAQIVGTPGVNADYLAFKSTVNFIQTEVRESAGQTVFYVARSMDSMAGNDTKPMFYSTYQSPAVSGVGNTYGVSGYGNGVGVLVQSGARGNDLTNHTSAGVSIAGNDFAKWALYVGVVEPGLAPHRAINKTQGIASAGAMPTLPRLITSGKFRIGSCYTGAWAPFAGTCEMALWACYSEVLTTPEIDAVVANIRAYMARRGITV